MEAKALNNRVIFIVYAVICWLPALSMTAQELPARVRPADFPFARNTALGGGHVGLDGDFSSLFTNPAVLAGVNPQISISEFVIAAVDVEALFRMATADNTLSELSSILVNRFYRFNTSLDVGGPIAFGMVGDNYGWGVFNVTRFDMTWERDQLYSVSRTLTEEFIFAGAYGLRLYDGPSARFDMGLMVKLLVRLGYASPPIYIHQLNYIIQDMVESPFETQLGAGADIGLRWTVFDSMSFAAVIYDPFSPVWVTQYSKAEKVASQEMTVQGTVPITPRASIGISWNMASPFWHRYFSGITFSLDYLGLLDNFSETSRSPLLNLSVGLEVRMLEVFTLRAGIRDLLPSGGVGLNYSFMNVDVAVYGRELGSEPYEYAIWGVTLDFSFRR
ncbi:MAG: hypothetical protein LBF80_03860 [Spirochaetaceae bacterium]|jgi:hypothetical protein|nr:hypothetical protein [Spirochaetaceae bacterium]